VKGKQPLKWDEGKDLKERKRQPRTTFSREKKHMRREKNRTLYGGVKTKKAKKETLTSRDGEK